MSNETKKINVYAHGLVFCSVCADKEATVEEIEDYVNKSEPTGIDSQWKLSPEKFANGDENPKICEDDKSKKHYLLSC